jgi:hypothetical protein
MRALQRLWKRPVVLQSSKESKPILFRFDGKEHTQSEGQA